MGLLPEAAEPGQQQPTGEQEVDPAARDGLEPGGDRPGTRGDGQRDTGEVLGAGNRGDIAGGGRGLQVVRRRHREDARARPPRAAAEGGPAGEAAGSQTAAAAADPGHRPTGRFPRLEVVPSEQPLPPSSLDRSSRVHKLSRFHPPPSLPSFTCHLILPLSYIFHSSTYFTFIFSKLLQFHGLRSILLLSASQVM